MLRTRPKLIQLVIHSVIETDTRQQHLAQLQADIFLETVKKHFDNITTRQIKMLQMLLVHLQTYSDYKKTINSFSVHLDRNL